MQIENFLPIVLSLRKSQHSFAIKSKMVNKHTTCMIFHVSQ